MNARTLSPLDRILAGFERALEAVAGAPQAARPSPGEDLAEAAMDDTERRHVAGLMRVNHTGEVCAQALYLGQAALARN
ncbi:MAG TPA: demethoxyubiquinone hydroxylase family protein, partial [Rhodanobacter sp.]